MLVDIENPPYCAFYTSRRNYRASVQSGYSIVDLRRFEIRNFKTQKWVSMFLTYLVENFFLVILRLRIFFYEKFSKKKSILRSIFRDFTGKCDPVLAKPYEVLEG